MSAGYVFIADDFTGASDTLATLARGGLEVRLFLDMPTPAEAAGLGAFGVATDARSLKRPELEALMRRLAAELEPHAPRFVHLKICSTFDSSAETGNFALAMQCLHDRLGFERRAIIGGQPSLGRYCIFGNLFALAGDGRVHRIDRHPVMRAHPVTPMSESNLVRHFAALGGGDAALVNRLALAAGAVQSDGRGIALYDALDDDDIARIGRTISPDRRTLWAGASSVAEAFAGARPLRRLAEAQSLDRPVLAFVGSRSAVSAEQVRAATSFTKVEIAARDLAGDRVRALADEIAAPLRRGLATLVFLSSDKTADLPPHVVAARSATLVSVIAERAMPGGLVVAGGDTSSAIVRALAPSYLQFLGDIDPGVPLCKATFADGRDLPMVLKGGQVGLPDLFDRIAHGVLRTD